MSKSRYKGKRSPGKKPVWLIVVAAVGIVLLITILLANGFRGGQSDGGSGSQTGTVSTDALNQPAKTDYEKWLAAAMIVGLSMEYPDFELNGIYTASETTIKEKQNSEGVYILFVSGGELKALHSAALEKERTTAGTQDISTEMLGFASFDLVDPASVETASMTQIQLEELTERISQSLLVSIYTH